MAESSAAANDKEQGSAVLNWIQQGGNNNVVNRGSLAVAFHHQISDLSAAELFCIHFNIQVKSNGAKSSGEDPTKSPAQP